MSPAEEAAAGDLRFGLRTSFLRDPGFDRSQRDGRRYARPVSGVFWARRYYRLLWVFDAIVICSVAAFAQVARFGFDNAFVVVGGYRVGYFPVSVAIAGAWMGALSVYRSRDKRVVGIGADEYKRVFSATVILLGLLTMACVVFEVDIARGYFALAFPLGCLGLMTSRWSLRRWLTRQRVHGHYLSRVVVLGAAEDVRYVINQIEKKSGPVYKVVGVALQGPERSSGMVVKGLDVPVVADIYSVVDAVAATEADAVIVAGQVEGGSRFIQELGWQLEESSTELILTTGLTNVAGPRIHSRPVEGLPLMHVELPHYAGGKHALKRLLDIVLSAVALVVLLPVFAVIAVLIRRDSPGPVVFRQERIGRGGQTFMMFKFRSMVETAEDDLAGLLSQNEGAGLLFKMQNDPRVTWVGRWLRRYSLDEFPQFWNVLLGDMSLVGPRPPLQREVDGYESHVHRRLYIKPGLTGMWQINGRSELNWQDSVRLDLYYVENWSIVGDIIILWRTARALFHPTGAY
ncbi:sugar transferase [Arthrobacter sp. MI7-26]|uniref:sugar transferase n=1 Tax=Arthrobacter sp. MI7-26 TaxID=2993653 RepID=UPI002248E1FB|nr:sugar transferase [Arthrobacter sp. MI7-26]MCX2748697.1 sugar transferase [Arthrobacter sp. MI7-26]